MTDESLFGKFALQQSKVTVSTVGVVPSMRRLASDVPAVSLALSLHAPNQELREQIVPAAKSYPLPELLQALDEHTAACRRPTPTSVGAMIEYVLLAGVNDGDAQAIELGSLMAPRTKDVMVNLIPYNPGISSALHGFDAPSHQAVERFQQIVAAHGVTTRVRREMGRDIAGACGQLALTKPGAEANANQAADLEDFVTWRRRQPLSAKQAVNEECKALVAAQAGASSPSSGKIASAIHSLLARLQMQTGMTTSSIALATVVTASAICLAVRARRCSSVE
eukprot:TRINITY_DN117349_c0_g1_i1.p1 TRINITY_DN117349_c0_g1~~TRINITY_DN117349_c0_g1_i1.p1  ORF type:complete len:304 (+),score=66.70 TRINITY_DN117349_c0_g1_i1:74-913(+)